MRLFKFVICYLLLFFNISFIYCQVNALTPKEKDGKWGYVNNKGKVVIKFQYMQAEPFSEGIALVRESNGFIPFYTFIDVKGKKVFPEEYFNAGSFSDGLAYVNKLEKFGKGNYGYINTTGELVIPFKYKIVEKFSNGFAVVGKDNPNEDTYGDGSSIFGVINTSDSLLSKRWFSNVTRFSKDTFIVTIKDKKYTLFSNGEFVFKENIVFNKNDTTSDNINFYVVETKPEFPGGEYEMMKWIAQTVIYPEIAKEKGIQGKVFVQFIIGKDGKISEVELIKGANPILDEEALRVISAMPAWKPGKHKGHLVNVLFQIPINFKLY